MNRREFLAASAVAGVAPLSALGGAEAQQQAGARELYELRRYRLLPGAKQRAFNEYVQNAAIPAMNRLGVSPVGAFTVMYGQNESSLYLLVPHPSFDSMLTLRERMMADPEYRRAGAAVIDAPLSDPAFVRVESSLLRAVPSMPALETPARAAGNGSRILELRVYESPSEAKALHLLDWIDRGWLPIFRTSGLTPVFFAETLVGRQMPSMQYLLVFQDLGERDAAWERFRGDPGWAALRASDPNFAETIHSIDDLILRPTAYSQI